MSSNSDSSQYLCGLADGPRSFCSLVPIAPQWSILRGEWLRFVGKLVGTALCNK